MERIAPLPASFMLTAILGFFISAIYIYNISPTWGLTFSIIFALMFVASLISMTYAPSPGDMRDIKIEVKPRRMRKKGK